ncbi:MAG: 2-C-methyl-D-erythritol 2,4-cyclodiphosphate synthase [candidate division Zixibacteria bacterium]|nr:2-C-methyl-D-erythritol 2,4-cyclodiphosphate synthase [candidate division Zixibacteria bacterium]
MAETRCGIGFDVHPFALGRKLILGGVEVEFHLGLAGHSDADVLTHAIIDALLGAAGLGDIGRHFPDTDPKYKDIASLLLLRDTAAMLDRDGWRVVNIDATIIAQRPRLSDHIDVMRQRLAVVLALDSTQVNIKATTTEKLGFTGREEGIAALAVTSILKSAV